MASNTTALPGSTGGMHPLAGFIDHGETYGAHVIARMIRRIPKVSIAADIGAGSGRDLALVRNLHPDCRTVALEANRESALRLRDKVDQVEVLNLETDRLPFEDGSVDLIIANQVLEHTKEVFWIFHEIARCLAPGGHLIMGVPNVLSLHNRLIGLFGIHPTQHKLYSAHVRPFSRRDTDTFVEVCSPGTFKLVEFAGSQFYPFPRLVSRALAHVFPGLAFSIFFDFQKVGQYNGSFLTYPAAAGLETNFYTG